MKMIIILLLSSHSNIQGVFENSMPWLIAIIFATRARLERVMMVTDEGELIAVVKLALHSDACL